jgi:deazaflavin-dependent oxidoreductase (nitroreductase family)
LCVSSAELRRIFRAPVYLYRWKCGWLLGHRFLLLIHVARRTGLRRFTVLEVVEYRKEGPEAVVISAFGPGADWRRNIEATPGAEVVIGSRRFPAAHRVLDPEEAVTGACSLRAAQPLDRPHYPPGAEPPPRLALRRLRGAPPPARRPAAVHRVPPGF